tara:strand:+ start:1294 stop:1599 length:306 start_codon:yes stop_codon:yes gene_type:complete
MTQVLTWNSSKNTDDTVLEDIAIYQFSDDTIVEIGNDQTVIKDASGNEQLIISDVNTSNVNHYTDVPDPESEYYGYKWFYTADGWVLNENWVDPRPPKEEE